LQRLKAIEQRLDALEDKPGPAARGLCKIFARTFEDCGYVRRCGRLSSIHALARSALVAGPPTLPNQVPGIAIVTPTLNQGRFLSATIDSVIGQNYPKVFRTGDRMTTPFRF
jgi:hypothetical protein